MISQQRRPIITLAMGDPAGISPELTAKLVALDEVRATAQIVVIGDIRVFNEGARVAGVTPALKTVAAGTNLDTGDDVPLFIDLAHLDPATIERGVASEAGGAFALANYRHALTLARDGQVDAVCFTPFNKRAMRLARPTYDDEIAFSAEIATRSAQPASQAAPPSRRKTSCSALQAARAASSTSRARAPQAFSSRWSGKSGASTRRR